MENYRIYEVIDVIEFYLSELGIEENIVLKNEEPKPDDIKYLIWEIDPIVVNNVVRRKIKLSKSAIDDLLSIEEYALSIKLNKEILEQCLIK